MNARIFHVTDQSSLAANSEPYYRCDSLEQEGFIHCCTKEQLSGVLERYYAGVTGLKLLEIDPLKLQAELVYENTVGGVELFPHVYGAINTEAVLAVTDIL